MTVRLTVYSVKCSFTNTDIRCFNNFVFPGEHQRRGHSIRSPNRGFRGQGAGHVAVCAGKDWGYPRCGSSVYRWRNGDCHVCTAVAALSRLQQGWVVERNLNDWLNICKLKVCITVC